MKKKVFLKIDGDKISAQQFRKSISSFYSLVEEVAREFTQKQHPFEWYVEVNRGSINLEFHPEVVDMPVSILDGFLDIFNTGLEDLKTSAERPEYFTDTALAEIETLANLPTRKKETGIKKITIHVDSKSHTLNPYYIAHVNDILEIKTKSLGSIEGELLTVSQRGYTKIIVYETLTDRAVQCFIPDEMLDDVFDAFGKRVYVFGEISYGKEGRPKHIRVDEIKVFPEDKILPSAYDVCGILGE